MPQRSEAFQAEPSPEHSFLDLLVETLSALEESVRAQFLRQFFRNIAQVDITESQCNEYWTRILLRRRELAEASGSSVGLQTAMLDVLSSSNFLRVPILMEYDEFRKLQVNAATDALTGLYNRRLFDEYLDKELNRAKRYGQQLAVVILDLHRLKEVNDRYGHLQGDHVLQMAAKTLRTTLRASDFAFRIGGDEFAVLLPQTDSEQAVTLCRRVRSQYESELAPLKMDIGVTLDFGVAIHPQDSDQKSALLSIADQRLYELKRSTRSQPRVVPIESRSPVEEPSAGPSHPPAPAPVQPAAPPPAPSIVPPPPGQAPPTEHRKWERVSLANTRAHAVLTDLSRNKTARVINLSYGGVVLQFDVEENIPNQFNAVLHVPILPPVRVMLRKVYALRTQSGQTRVGCSFVS